ncbi:protein MEI2-like 4 [Silene latifolia]|uniref:protein MEI2-like 4 n=1 Tax=Silene latifolia TaxID=37657 RepID=UPI003D7859EA
MVGEDGYAGVYRTQLRSVNQSKTMHPDVYFDSTRYIADNRHLAGVVAAQNESSLFSSSLSDLVQHKLRLSSNKILSRQSSGVARHNGELDPFKSPDESEGQTINSLLPDEEELFSGIADEMGHMGHANAVDDLEDFDLFIGSGGIELEGDDHLKAGPRNVGYPRGLHQRIHSTQRLPNGSKIGDASSYDSSRLYDGYPSSLRMPSVGSEFGHFEASHPFPRSMSNVHPHSPQVPLHNVVNVLPQRNFDSLSGIADDIRPKVYEKVNLGMPHLGLNGHGMELNEGGFGYSSNRIHIPQSTASKSNSYQHHHLGSLLIPNSRAFLNSNPAHHIGKLPGSPGAQHLMMNISSPTHHQLQVGSAPVLKASLWERQQRYSGESHEASAYQMGSIRSLGIPGFSPSHPPEISSYGSFSHITDACKNGGLRSSQQKGRMFHERNSMNSLPTSFGSPSERSRSRRNETNLSHSDRKHYMLNMDRILRGDDRRTTLMIKNIPNKYTSKMLLATIDEQHRGQYDFVYLPIDFKNKCNMGYAFINMIDPIQIVGFHQTFEGRKWEKFNSEKVATLAYARIQGKGALISHFQNSSLMNEDKRCRPILFHTDGPNAGDQEPFPLGTSFRTKSGRHPMGGSEEDE